MIPARSAVGRLAATAALLVLVAAGCGSGGDDTATSAAGPSGSTAAGQSAASAVPADNSAADEGAADDGAAATAEVPDPCALVSDQAASALVGQDVTGVAAPVEDVPYAVCQWGEIIDDHMLAVQVSGEQDGIRYLQVLTSASAQTATASSVGTDGQYFPEVGYIYGGGGVGQSVLFRHGDWDVLVGLTGKDGATQAELEALAADVDAALP